MPRSRVLLTTAAFLATFAWLAVPQLKDSPAVLWPSFLAVGLAFLTRDIYLSLFAGALSGAILLRQGNVIAAFADLFARDLLPALQDRWNISVLVFTLTMGGLVELLNRQGGMNALASWIVGRAASRRRAALGAYIMGWMVFFDGLASSMLVGKTMRPAAARAGLSPEKLSFIVDSTSAPVAGLSLISTWVAYEMVVIKQGFENFGDAALLDAYAPFQLLVQSLPYRFYNYFILLVVFLTIWMGREFGPMLPAERNSKPVAAPGPEPAGQPRASSRWIVMLALVPLSILVFGVLGGMYVDGGGLDRPFSLDTLIVAFGKANAADVFVYATAAAVVAALALSPFGTRPGPGETSVSIFFEGMKQMFLPTLILVFAWMLNSVIKELGTAQYLVSLLNPQWPVGLLPVLVFALACVVSFSTGTSWGTMAVLMPLVIPVAVRWTGLAPDTGASPVLIATIGSVLAGAVWGDHCSPISDTAIISAFSSDCDVMAHVRTQLPYCVAAALLAAGLGYIPAGWHAPPWLLLALGCAACWALVRYGCRPVGRR